MNSDVMKNLTRPALIICFVAAGRGCFDTETFTTGGEPQAGQGGESGSDPGGAPDRGGSAGSSSGGVGGAATGGAGRGMGGSSGDAGTSGAGAGDAGQGGTDAGGSAGSNGAGQSGRGGAGTSGSGGTGTSGVGGAGRAGSGGAGTTGVGGAGTAGVGGTSGGAGGAAGGSSILVPGGTFDRLNDARFPATVSDFKLDAHEITVGRFRNFVAGYPGSMPSAGSGKNPHDSSDQGWLAEWSSPPYMQASQINLVGGLKSCGVNATWTDAPGQNEGRPLNCITWYEAFAFCIWDSGRLPTEAEWNYAAAGGSEQRLYPWSVPAFNATIDPSYASYLGGANECLGDGAPECTLTDIVNAGSKPNGRGRWGHTELGGNLFELVRDMWGDPPVSCVDCAQHQPATARVQRGGSFAWSPGYIDNSTRRAVEAGERWSDIGSRCARVP